MSILPRRNLDPPPISLCLRVWWVDSFQLCGRLVGKLRWNFQFQEPLTKCESIQPFNESPWSTITFQLDPGFTILCDFNRIVMIKSS